MSKYDSFMQGLAQKFSKDGFRVLREVRTQPYSLDIVACKHTFDILKGHMNRFIMITSMDPVSKERVLDFSARATKYAMDNSTMLLPDELGRSSLTVPTILTGVLSADLKDWIGKRTFKKYWGAFEFPVIISTNERTLYYSLETPLWGAALYNGFRTFVEEKLGFRTDSDQTPPGRA